MFLFLDSSKYMLTRRYNEEFVDKFYFAKIFTGTDSVFKEQRVNDSDF